MGAGNNKMITPGVRMVVVVIPKIKKVGTFHNFLRGNEAHPQKVNLLHSLLTRYFIL